MKRVIVDYKKLNKNILNQLVEKFPDGYNDEDIISFRNQHNEAIEAVEVRTEETVYLVKISKRLADTMQSFEEDDNSIVDTKIPKEVSKEEVGDIEGK
ncbi:hypothetical protein ATE84_4439 [Aquimarina sp. MAR_2010_214]|uniref:hypothetical protein n=1 Tax=Aquimarina sp. MAR_2010_214 TaxID=1250026 RepID=UPI000CAE3BFA|nr:hypothetical protein [Aquimarina sp. MAR_2010_214]PKV52327.1 hypothetical protein ATE84_4439 [Aquimarina sp. MAR_2010_214]